MIEAFSGVGLRPLSVCHLRANKNVSSDYLVDWIRRTRIDGDSWSGVEVPLGELREIYLVRVLQGATVLREVTVGAPSWTYSLAQRTADGIVGQTFDFAVAQLSDSFGPGPFVRMMIND